jgi:hypothetical protein
MGDESEYKVKYLDGDDVEDLNWVARAGKALVTYGNGCTYEGYFNSEKQKHGFGVYSWIEPDEEAGAHKKVASFEGMYTDGKKHGLGKMTFPNGDVYNGEWKENKMEGEGTYMYAKTKDIYSGAWVAGLKHGTGCYEYGETKSQLNGSWESGAFVSGEWVLSGAGIFQGGFQGGKPSGPGQFVFASGVTQSGDYSKRQAVEDEDASLIEPTWSGTQVYSTVAA